MVAHSLVVSETFVLEALVTETPTARFDIFEHAALVPPLTADATFDVDIEELVFPIRVFFDTNFVARNQESILPYPQDVRPASEGQSIRFQIFGCRSRWTLGLLI
jgi:hypothetical protein